MISKYIKFSLPITITFDYVIKIFSSIFFIFYAFGFLIWNVYLSIYGVFEYNLLQTRYISAGLVFSVFTTIIVLIFYCLNLLYKSLRKKLNLANEKYDKINKVYKFFEDLVQKLNLGIIFLLLLMWPFVFSLFIFPNVPQFLGGSKAIPASLIGNPDQMIYLSNYDIGLEDNSANKASVQTKPVCILYQNQDFILVGVVSWEVNGSVIGAFPRRILILKKDQINGFQLKGGWVGKIKCPVEYFFNLSTCQ